MVDIYESILYVLESGNVHFVSSKHIIVEWVVSQYDCNRRYLEMNMFPTVLFKGVRCLSQVLY